MESCRFFAQGRCVFGSACRLAHNAPSTRAVGPAQPQVIPSTTTRGCPGVPVEFQDWPEDSYFQDPSAIFGAPAAPSADAASEPREALPSRDSELKEIKKIQKILRDIDSLEDRRAAGEGLQGNQLRKLERRAEHVARLQELEALIAEDELVEYDPPPVHVQAEAAPTPFVQEEEQLLPPPVPRIPGASSAASVRSNAGRQSAEVCRHFLNGRCIFGDACRSSHDVHAIPSGRMARAPIEPSFDLEDPECGICFESIRRKNERFGILENCDHAFCLTCIRSWRKQREQQDRQNLRLCPVCRNESFFVVPSDDVLVDPVEKRLLIENYKQELGKIPCKLFDYGRGSCPFGTSCFYSHLNPDGTRYVPPPLRWRNGADGSEVISEVKLSDFVTRSLALP